MDTIDLLLDYLPWENLNKGALFQYLNLKMGNLPSSVLSKY